MKTILSELVKPLPPPEYLQESAIEPALRRVGALQGHPRLVKLSILRWFVELAQRDLNASSPAEVLATKEEYAALQRHFWSTEKPTIPLSLEVEATQKTIAFHLPHLVDDGIISLGPFTFNVLIILPQKFGARLPGGHSGIDSREVRKGTHSQILYEMALLLKEFATFVVRCPKCRAMFVKPRANAAYCSRSCQNADYMQKKRNVEKEKPNNRKRGGHRHGKKRR